MIYLYHLFILLLPIVLLGQSNQQFLLFDVEFTYSKYDADHSSPSKSHFYVKDSLLEKNIPKDWTSPIDYRNGTVHIRIEVLEKPTGGFPTKWTLCYIPDKGQGNGYGCTSTPIYQEEGIYEADIPMTEFWENESIIWSEGIKQMDLVIKDDSGGQGHAHKREDHENFFPTRVRITMVQVAKGATYDSRLIPSVAQHKLIPSKQFPQSHPRIYIRSDQKEDFLARLANVQKVKDYVVNIEKNLAPYLEQHQSDPKWIVSRLQMYWHTKYRRVYVNGMDFSHGEGVAPVPTVRFSGSRDWDTDYLVPNIEDIKPYMDDPRGMYLQNGQKTGQPWEWVKVSETGHIVERINKKILDLAEDAAFLYWINGDERYARFASDIFMPYIEGMYHRDPPLTFEDHKNKDLMGLQTFEVIHEGVIKPITLCYDFLYSFLKKENKDLQMIQEVFRKWADQEIKYGVPGNNWNLMQARYITYLALALESNTAYTDGKGQEYYLDQVMNQNSRKQKALRDVMNNFDSNTGIWPEVAHYSIMVSDDILEVFSLMDKTLNNQLLEKYPILEKAILSNFHYLYPNGFTTAYGDAKHARLRFRALELLIAQYRKYHQYEKEELVTRQLKRFIADNAYNREEITSLFQMFFYVEELTDVPAAESFSDLVSPTFYSPNVSWIVQRNGHSRDEGMMISKNASLGNHSHANGINIELYAKGMVVFPDAAAGVSYWSDDHKQYYSRFPAHNTVVVDGISDYRTMNSTQAFQVKSIYPTPTVSNNLKCDFTFSDVNFIEPKTQADQHRLTGTVRTSSSSGYFVDIFRSGRQDGKDKKHEYILHGQGEKILLMKSKGKEIRTKTTDELSPEKGDQIGYDYFENKRSVDFTRNFVAGFQMPSNLGKDLFVNVWMKGEKERTIFTVKSPYSRAIHPETVPKELYHKPLPTLVVRQKGEAKTRPFVSIIEPFHQDGKVKVEKVSYFNSTAKDKDFVGIVVSSSNNRIDYIYNHIDRIPLIFSDGAFTGTYGIVNFQDDTISSLFLGDGTILEKGGFKIVTSGDSGGILVEIVAEGLVVHAEKPFKLSFPIDGVFQQLISLVSIDKSGKEKIFRGILQKKNGHQFVEFELPILEHQQLKLRY